MEATQVRGDEYQGLLSVGQRVHSILYGGRDGIITEINGEQTPETIKRIFGGAGVMGGSADIRIVFVDHETSVPEAIIRGVQWFISDEIVSEEETSKALRAAYRATAEAKAEQERKAIEKQEEREALPGRNLHLIPITDKDRRHTHAAKNMRIELKMYFPKIKFSVKSDSFAGGNSIDISWTDGPTTEQVKKAVTGKYSAGNFDGMTDSYEYSREVFPEIFGGSKYVTENRHVSDELTLHVAKSFGFNPSSGKPDNYGNIPGLSYDDSRMIYRECHKTSYYTAKTS